MLPAIFLLSIIAIILSQLNNCLPKRFLCEKRSRQTPIVRAVVRRRPASPGGSVASGRSSGRTLSWKKSGVRVEQICTRRSLGQGQCKGRSGLKRRNTASIWRAGNQVSPFCAVRHNGR